MCSQESWSILEIWKCGQGVRERRRTFPSHSAGMAGWWGGALIRVFQGMGWYQPCSEKCRSCSALTPDTLPNTSGTEFLAGGSTERIMWNTKGLAMSASSYPPMEHSKVPAKNRLVQFVDFSLLLSWKKKSSTWIWCQQQSCGHGRNWILN